MIRNISKYDFRNSNAWKDDIKLKSKIMFERESFSILKFEVIK